MPSSNTFGGKNKYFKNCTHEGMGTNGSATGNPWLKACRARNQWGNGVPMGVFGKLVYRNFFFVLRTALGGGLVPGPFGGWRCAS